MITCLNRSVFITRSNLWEWDENETLWKMRWVSENRRVHLIWVVVSIVLYFHPYLGKWFILTNIFQMGWNHQLVMYYFCDLFVVVFAILRKYRWGIITKETVSFVIHIHFLIVVLRPWLGCPRVSRDCNGKPCQRWFTVSENHHHSFSSARKKEISFMKPLWIFPCFGGTCWRRIPSHLVVSNPYEAYNRDISHGKVICQGLPTPA